MQFFRPQREVDVDHHQGDQRQGGKVVDHVDHAEDVLPEPVGISVPPRRIDLHHHQPAGHDGGQAHHRENVVDQLLRQGVFARQPGWPGADPEIPARQLQGVAQIRPIDPHGPKVLPEGCAYRMRDHQHGQHDAADPVDRHPREFDSQDGQERGSQQDQRRDRHPPVKQPIDQRVTYQPPSAIRRSRSVPVHGLLGLALRGQQPAIQQVAKD